MVIIHSPPNEIERIDAVWAIVSVDANGEGICGIGGTMMSMVTATMRGSCGF